jgi:hypothetical protein
MYCRAAYTVCAITEALNAFGAHHRRTEWLALSSCDLSQDRCRGPNRPRGLPRDHITRFVGPPVSAAQRTPLWREMDSNSGLLPKVGFA